MRTAYLTRKECGTAAEVMVQYGLSKEQEAAVWVTLEERAQGTVRRFRAYDEAHVACAREERTRP